MRSKEVYNERRKKEDHCSSCGKYIGLITPRYCEKCNARQSNTNKSAGYVKKGLPKTKKLKVYKKPSDSWRIYLYHQYKIHGIKELSKIVGVHEGSLLKHIFDGVNPLDNYRLMYMDYFRKFEREDLAIEIQNSMKKNNEFIL